MQPDHRLKACIRGDYLREFEHRDDTSTQACQIGLDRLTEH